MNVAKFYPMAYALAAHTNYCALEQRQQPKQIHGIPFLADLTDISNKITKLFATKKDIYETALHIKQLIEQAPQVPQENHDELLSMAYIELENQFPEQQEELKVVKYNIFKLKS